LFSRDALVAFGLHELFVDADCAGTFRALPGIGAIALAAHAPACHLWLFWAMGAPCEGRAQSRV